MAAARRPAYEALEIDRVAGLVRKHAPITLDLNGIAKGYCVDKLAKTLRDFGVTAFLVGIDGEMRASELRADGMPWTVAVETPDPERRTPCSILTLTDAAVATSGNYRSHVTVQGQPVTHGGPVDKPSAPCVTGLGHGRRRHLCGGRRLGERTDGAGPASWRRTRFEPRPRCAFRQPDGISGELRGACSHLKPVHSCNGLLRVSPISVRKRTAYFYPKLGGLAAAGTT